jgi:nicotinate phosphoribosyltransferase
MKSLLLEEGRIAFVSDLYELTMAAAYFENRERHRAVFELFVRTYPRNRCYLIAAGLEQAMHYLLNMKFDADMISFLRAQPAFNTVSKEFFEYLSDFRFTGNISAVPEGTVVFTNEPILRVVAPILEAQIVETYLLSSINFQTLIATKASRVVQAARGRGVVEFGARRAHGPQAALLAARAAYIGGCVGTSNVLAGYELGIPTYGTIAHSFIMNYDTEREAFEKYCRVFRSEPAILVDTYDTMEGTKNAIEIGKKLSMVRLDSGDIGKLSIKVRRALDRAGLTGTKIFVSGDMNEYKINDLVARRAPIDAFGVGTELVTSRDDPALPGIYKLVAIERNGKWLPRVKTSAGKQTLPGPKQIFRKHSKQRKLQWDILGMADEDPPKETVALLNRIVEGGCLVYEFPKIEEIQKKALVELRSLPLATRKLKGCKAAQVRLSPRLKSLCRSLHVEHQSSRGESLGPSRYT